MATKYERIISHIFDERFEQGSTGFDFPRAAIQEAADAIHVSRVSNVGDVIYTFRSRKSLPASIREHAPRNREWIIRTTSSGSYRFDLIEHARFHVNSQLSETKIPDSTPALIHLYRQSDEQALLAIIRYNRLVDIFTRLSCFSVQSHLRTSLQSSGQIEVDELYVGLDRRGAHYVLPVEVKSASDQLGFIQIDNMFELCRERFSGLVARPIAAQFISDDQIAMLEFERRANSIEIDVVSERRFRLVPSSELPPDLIASYGRRADH